jgi:hypothetical protein
VVRPARARQAPGVSAPAREVGGRVEAVPGAHSGIRVRDTAGAAAPSVATSPASAHHRARDRFFNVSTSSEQHGT